MKAPYQQFVWILTLSVLSAVTACRSCLIDLAGGGILKIGSTRSTPTKNPQQHSVSHSSALPIGIASRELIRPIIPRFHTDAIYRSGLGYIVVRKLLVDLHNHRDGHAQTISIAAKPLERRRTSPSQIYDKFRQIWHADSDAEKDETNSDEQDTVDEKKEAEVIMSQSMIMAIGFYKQFISPLLPPACRFLPTCSQYGVQAITEFGPTKGVILTAWRLARCSPLGGKGKLSVSFMCTRFDTNLNFPLS